jgi:hypothetical protein
MNSVTDVVPVGSAINRATLPTRFFEICYLTAITVSTFGWVSALSWTTFRLAKWVMA